MKNENLPEIDQGLHERLCAYVFGELQGPERAAFEAELLRSPALRRAKEQLEATVGLVQRAVPDEGLSPDVRRELLASARRSRFRFVPGRRMLQLVAACVVIAGGVLVWRQRGFGTERSPEVRDGARVARMEAPTKLVERTVENAPKAETALPQSVGAVPEETSSALAFQASSTELGLLDALGYAGGEEADLDAVVSDTAFAIHPWATNTPAEPPATVSLAGHGGPTSSGVYTLTQTPSPGAPASRASAGATTTGADGFFLGHANQQEGEKRPLPGAAGPTGTYRGPGDTKPPSSFAIVELEKKAVAPPADESLEELRELGYVGDGNEVQQAREVMGKSLTVNEPEQNDIAAVEQLLAEVAQDRARGKSSALDAQGAALVPPARERVAAEVEQILGSCRVGAGESPGDMFFRYFGEAPFVATLEERTSTFAADVDTASYALARAYLNQGQLPPREAVRTEEFVNYFRADQPPPADGQPFALGLELAPSLFGGDARSEMLRVSVRGRDVADFERQPLALTFVIDNSGSMAHGERLELVKRALALLLRQLYASDSVAIVKFSNTAAVVTPMIQATRRGELEGLIAGLPIEGGTNVEAGLRLGYEQALQTLQRRGVNRVILCSDGVGNIGETSAKGLLALVEDARKQGIYLNTVGVGMGNHDDAFLEELADKGDGVCNYVDSDAEAKRVFVDGLANLVQPIARDVKIQVEFDPAQVESWRLLGYENRALRTQDFRNDAIDAGEVNAGHQVSALYELVRRPGTGAPLATARLRYKPPFAIDAGREGRAARVEAEQALEIERTVSGSDALPGFAAATSGYQRAVLAAQFAEVLRQSVHARPDSFATLLGESRRLAGTMGDPDVAELVTLLERANPLLDALTKEETSRVRQLREQLGRLHYEQALRERQHELARQAGEPELAEEARHDLERVAAETRATIQRLEAELRTELFRARGVEPPAPETLERLKELGYTGDR